MSMSSGLRCLAAFRQQGTGRPVSFATWMPRRRLAGTRVVSATVLKPVGGVARPFLSRPCAPDRTPWLKSRPPVTATRLVLVAPGAWSTAERRSGRPVRRPTPPRDRTPCAPSVRGAGAGAFAARLLAGPSAVRGGHDRKSPSISAHFPARPEGSGSARARFALTRCGSTAGCAPWRAARRQRVRGARARPRDGRREFHKHRNARSKGVQPAAPQVRCPPPNGPVSAQRRTVLWCYGRRAWRPALF